MCARAPCVVAAINCVSVGILHVLKVCIFVRVHV